MTVATDQSRPPHPVAFDVEYPQRVSRLTTFFRLFMAIPQFIVIYLLLMAMGLITILAWFAILFTGRYPKSFFEFSSGVMRWQANVWAYVALLRDEYPPFSLEPGEYPVALDIPLAERQSRFRLFIRVFAIWPNQVVLQLVMYGWFFTTFLSWWMILFTGRYPRGLFRFSVGVLRWQQRQLAYLYLLRDEYPPYSVNANARPGNEVVSLVVGVPLFFLFVAAQFLPFIGLLRSEEDHVQVVSTLQSRSQLRREAPTGSANGTRITLLDFIDDTALPRNSGAKRQPGYRVVDFTVRAEKDGAMPVIFSPYFFRLHDCDGEGYSPDAAASRKANFQFAIYWFGGSTEGDVYFQIPTNAEPCDLIYHAGLGEVHFNFSVR